MTTTRQDSTGHTHTRRCWERAEGRLMDELVAADLDLTVEYLDDDAADFRVPSWDATQQEIVAMWLSDGTVPCDCAE